MASRADIQRLRQRVEHHYGNPETCSCATPVLCVVIDDDPPETLQAVEDGLCPRCGGRVAHVLLQVLDAEDRDL